MFYSSRNMSLEDCDLFLLLFLLLLKIKYVGDVKTLPNLTDNTISNIEIKLICNECDTYLLKL